MANTKLTWVFLLLLLVIVVGSVGYQVIEGFSPVDATFLTVSMISTVGSPLTQSLSDAGKVFTTMLIVGGVGIAIYALVSFTDWMLENVEKVHRLALRDDLRTEELIEEGQESIDIFEGVRDNSKMAVVNVPKKSSYAGKTKLDILKSDGVIIMAAGKNNRFTTEIQLTQKIKGDSQLVVMGAEKNLKKFEKKVKI